MVDASLDNPNWRGTWHAGAFSVAKLTFSCHPFCMAFVSQSNIQHFDDQREAHCEIDVVLVEMASQRLDDEHPANENQK